MKYTLRFPTILPALVLLIVTSSCLWFSGQTPATETPALEDILTQIPADTAAPAVPTSEEAGEPPAQQPAETPQNLSPSEPQAADEVPCDKKVCFYSGHFLLSPPIGSEYRDTIDTSSRYGTLRKRIRNSYYGAHFLNSAGTPVLAAADGVVVVAGDDSLKNYGARVSSYGNLVILEHSLPGVTEPVYTLYAHLSKVAVDVDDNVERGEQIGEVGMSGSVVGSTLAFEVRYGKNAYLAARNPELWLQPQKDGTGDPTGALAGRVIDKQGNFVQISHIRLENLRAAGGSELKPIFLRTYLDREQRGAQPWLESFATGGLPEGTYVITFWYQSNRYQRQVEVQPGMLTLVTFDVK